MSLPTLVRTWQMSVNNQQLSTGAALGNNQLLLHTIKNTILGFGSGAPTVRYSCNGTTAGTAGDGIDRWAATTDLVWGATTRSWIVFRQAGIGATFEFLIDLNNGNSAYGTFVISPAAGFTGGTTTARPTATDEVVVRAAGDSGFLPHTTPASWRYSVWQSTDGKGLRVVIAHGGAAQCLMLVDGAANTVSGWTVPAVAYWGAAFAASAHGTATGTSSRLMTRANSAPCAVAITGEGFANGFAVDNTSAGGNAANELSGEWALYPLGLWGITAGARGRHGTLVDLWYGSGGASSGDTYPLGTPNFVQFGNFVMPWDGTTTPALS